MSEHFQSVFRNESVMGEECELMQSTVPSENVDVTITDIKRLLEQLDENKAQGSDEIAPRVLKECRDELAVHIHVIIEKSLKEGKVP